MKSDMNQVQVPPFEPKLCQNVATASRKPPECLPPPKILPKSQEILKSDVNPVQVPQFEPKLCKNVATASRNPLECLPPPQNPSKNTENPQKC